MLQTLRRRWFLLMLLATLVVGIGWGEDLASVAERLPRDWIIGCVLLAMALPLKITTMWSTVRRPAPALLAVLVNLIVVPALAWGASFLLSGDLAIGMIITAAVPCTLASAAVWTRLAGGNDAISLLVTMVTNLSCFVITPAMIFLLAGRNDSEVDFVQMANKLFVLIVLPISVAQVLRTVRGIGTWATDNKIALSTCAQLGMLSIVFIGAVNCGLKLAGLEGQITQIAGQLVLMLVLTATVHSLAWWIGYKLAQQFRMERSAQLAVAFAGSQKTLMVGLAVALPYGGLTVLPMLAYHVQQLVIDTVLADRYRHQPAE